MRRGKKTKGLRDMDFNAVYKEPFPYEPRNCESYCNIDSERIQEILKKNGKVTWGDVYAPWMGSRDPFDKLEGRYGIVSMNPAQPMKCVLDIHFGDWYWIPKEDV